MRKRTSLGQAAEIIRQSSANHWDAVSPADAICFQDLGRMDIDSTPYFMTDSAKRLVASRLKIPFEYLKRCPAHLQKKNLNHWIETLKHKKLFLRFDGNRLRAMFTTRYRVINNTDIMDRLLEAGYSKAEDVFLNFSDEIMVLNMPNHENTFGFLKERITPGMSLINSEVGVSAFSVQAFFLRLICTNGLIAAEKAQNKIRHIKENALEYFHAMIGHASAMAEQNQDKMPIAAQSRVEEPLSTIDSFNRQFGVRNDECDMVKAAWHREPDYSMWGVINAYTLAAQDSGITPEHFYRLQQIGGLILNLVKK